ncbi:Hypothetical predicted protein [Mytilus galloprovincialis]|uniref:Uncharacterized protein n=2 Tax=Mytilus galloprovincialis TaxID=29158 RepID=A0A8B6EVL5_MYTGA|nr:Hypothetical predicted protein [Mytilus galloprovincialis]
MFPRMVLRVYVLTVVYMFSFVGRSLGSEKYGDCIKYAVWETKSELSNGDRFCLTEDDYVYCKEFDCPATECEQPIVPETGGCSYCKGTCSYGGAIYPVDPRFLIACLDGSNRCSCGAKNSIASSRRGTIPRWMCFKKGSYKS